MYKILKEGSTFSLECMTIKECLDVLKNIRETSSYKDRNFSREEDAIFFIVDDNMNLASDNYAHLKFGKDWTEKEDVRPAFTQNLKKEVIKELYRLAIRSNRLSNIQKYGVSNKEYRRMREDVLKYLEKKTKKEEVNSDLYRCRKDIEVTKLDIFLLETAKSDLNKCISLEEIRVESPLFLEIEVAAEVREKTLRKKRDRLELLKKEESILLKEFLRNRS